MKSTEPPPLATWLLQRFGAKDALVGDLIEQHRRGRTSAWYWRQVLTAILATAYQDIRDHKWLVVKAILIASGFRLLELFVLGFVMQNVFHGLFAWAMTLPPVAREPVSIVINQVVPAAGMGWIVGRLNRQHRAAMVLAVAALTLIPVSVPFLFPSEIPDLLRRAGNALVDSRYIPALVTQLTSMIIVFGSVLLGGLSVPPDNKQRLSPEPPVSA